MQQLPSTEIAVLREGVDGQGIHWTQVEVTYLADIQTEGLSADWTALAGALGCQESEAQALAWRILSIISGG